MPSLSFFRSDMMKRKFFGRPSELVTTRKKNLYTQEFKTVSLFHFDEKGEFITDNEELIKKLYYHFDSVEIKEENNVTDDKPVETTELEIRLLAKEKGIKSWHIKSIDKLMAELKEE